MRPLSGSSYWVALFARHNIAAIRRSIKQLLSRIETSYGQELASWQGQPLPIPLDIMLHEIFGITFTTGNLPTSR